MKDQDFKFSSGVLLDLGAVKQVSAISGAPDGQTFFIWVTFFERPEKYRYLLGANAEAATAQYRDILQRLSNR